MKLVSESTLAQLQSLLKKVSRYSAFIFTLVFLGVYVYLVQYIGGLIQDEPSVSTSENAPKPVNKLKVDEEAVKKITELESQNIEIKSIFDQARQNPFTE